MVEYFPINNREKTFYSVCFHIVVITVHSSFVYPLARDAGKPKTANRVGKTKKVLP